MVIAALFISLLAVVYFTRIKHYATNGILLEGIKEYRQAQLAKNLIKIRGFLTALSFMPLLGLSAINLSAHPTIVAFIQSNIVELCGIAFAVGLWVYSLHMLKQVEDRGNVQ